jgi:hypothetical protein
MEKVLKVIRTWASLDLLHPQHIIDACDKALGIDKQQRARP